MKDGKTSKGVEAGFVLNGLAWPWLLLGRVEIPKNIFFPNEAKFIGVFFGGHCERGGCGFR